MKDFLSSRKGLEYLIIKYPDLTVEQAINEYKLKQNEK